MTTLLTVNQYKLLKGRKQGYMTAGINLSPAEEAEDFLVNNNTMCAMAGFCGSGCLNKTGLNVFQVGINARIKRTMLFDKDLKEFLARAEKEIQLFIDRAKREGLAPAIRPNLLSDQLKMAKTLAKTFPDVQFYDYTKLTSFYRWPVANYHLTYSFSENTRRVDVVRALKHRINIAVVFGRTRHEDLPDTCTLHGEEFNVIDGDADDLRFLDPVGVVVGLRWKGSKARMNEAIEAGFVVGV